MLEVVLKGKKEIVLVHREQQGEKEANFAERMFDHFKLIKLKDYTAEEFIKRGPQNPLVWAYLPLTRFDRSKRPQIAAMAKGGVLDTVKEASKRATLFSLRAQSGFNARRRT